MKRSMLFLLLLLTLALVGIMPLTAQGATECEPGFRLVAHALGETCVPETPQRVVALGPASFEFAYLSGKTIVGATAWPMSDLIYVEPELEVEFADITDVGFPVNLEIILALAPDLIIGHEEESIVAAYDELSAIAPTVIQADETNRNWETAAEFWSGVLGSETTFAEMKASYDARIAALHEGLPEDAETLEVSVLVASSPEFTFAWLPNTGIGKILTDAGISRPESQREPTERGVVPISQETLDLADGDAIFLFGYPYTDEESVTAQDAYLAELLENPLWQTLSAVQNERVFRVPDYWYRGIYYLATQKVIDDLFTHLAGVDAAEAAPDAFMPAAATEEAAGA
jgi:iron complex transport system substrate-binding protein